VILVIPISPWFFDPAYYMVSATAAGHQPTDASPLLSMERGAVMMGKKDRTQAQIAALTLDELVPADHFFRHLDRVLDLSFVLDLVQGCYAAGKGRPSIDPIVFFRLHLVMFFEGIRSERQLLRLAADRLSVRWYLGYNLDEALPDHSSLTRIRTRYGLEVFWRFFEAIVEQCQQAGLVWGHELYFDATHVLADAAMESLTARFAVEARAALHAHLAALFPDESDSEPSPRDLPDPQNLTHQGMDSADTTAVSPDLPTSLPTVLSDGERAALVAANEARHDWIMAEGKPQREVRGPNNYYQRVADFRVSTTDPDATPLRLKGGGTHLGYQTHYVVDGGKRRIILGVLVAPGEVMENQPMLDLAWHVRFRSHLRPHQATGDTTYGTLENITALEREGIRAYMPLPDWEHKTAYFGPWRFIYDAARDVYVCPQGQPLRPYRHELSAEKVEYRAAPATCNACPVKGQCTPSAQGRIVHRHFAEAFLDRVRAYHQGEPYAKAMRKRKVWVEPLFAEAKDWHGLRRFRLRRLWRVNCEALLTATGQNLKRLLTKRGWGRRPFPDGVAAAVMQSHCLTARFVRDAVRLERRRRPGGVVLNAGHPLIAA
jgi:transposase